MFNERLKSCRLKANLSQKEMGELLHISQQAYAKWENDKATPNPEAITELAKIFNVTTDYLLGNETNEENKKDDKIQTIAAHFDGDMTQEEMEEIINFVKYVKSKRD